MSTKIPDRWEAYSPYGGLIADRFIPMKVPLSRNFTSVRPEDRFTPTDAIARLPLGLVIDLTNTARYYEPNELSQGGVSHVKLQVMGKMVPKDAVVRRFIQIVDDYYRRPESHGRYVGVHCTHGLNRTGYLVCAYLILKLRYRARDAIDLFNARRGHEMERPNYLDNLYKMEGTSLEVSNAPHHRDYRRQPEWGQMYPQSPGPSMHRNRDWRNNPDFRSSEHSSSVERQPHWRTNPPPPHTSRSFTQRPPKG
ncbi:RNA/RNP complex-1-interacting phosphatase homolog [Anopheles darlingi]|uniref:RNA/RNP complex-1-interacting phosphatase homolog n=1 Tax=Anopheles darlingi TaxID=43151 RepID=UPI0021002425|nr:RNA/RNP complex-1-interacting phosphatase homolog [Anopheles darlingi]